MSSDKTSETYINVIDGTTATGYFITVCTVTGSILWCDYSRQMPNNKYIMASLSPLQVRQNGSLENLFTKVSKMQIAL